MINLGARKVEAFLKNEHRPVSWISIFIFWNCQTKKRNEMKRERKRKIAEKEKSGSFSQMKTNFFSFQTTSCLSYPWTFLRTTFWVKIEQRKQAHSDVWKISRGYLRFQGSFPTPIFVWIFSFFLVTGSSDSKFQGWKIRQNRAFPRLQESFLARGFHFFTGHDLASCQSVINHWFLQTYYTSWPIRHPLSEYKKSYVSLWDLQQIFCKK